jgi:hypothetical protein
MVRANGSTPCPILVQYTWKDGYEQELSDMDIPPMKPSYPWTAVNGYKRFIIFYTGEKPT